MRRWIAPYGFLGLALITASWSVAWTHLPVIGEHYFFPMWCGYIVLVDALVQARAQARTLLQAGPWRVARLFAISAIVWWLFEAFNLRTGNWHYLMPSSWTSLHFAVEATIDFSTVLPAIFETAALLHCLLPGRHQGRDLGGAFTPVPARLVWGAISLGLLYLALPLLFPQVFFGLIWGCLLLLVDPLNVYLGQPTVISLLQAGRLRPVGLIALSGLICGFFWEMWNSLAMPKWFYTIPLIPQARLFEMPYWGYLGYLPFALECFALYHLALHLCGERSDHVAWTLGLTAQRRQEAMPYAPDSTVAPEEALA